MSKILYSESCSFYAFALTPENPKLEIIRVIISFRINCQIRSDDFLHYKEISFHKLIPITRVLIHYSLCKHTSELNP